MEVVASTALFLLVVAAVTPLVRILAKYAIVRYRFRNVPGPQGIPLLGNVHQLGSDGQAYFKQLRKWAREYREQGYFVFFSGLRPFLVIFNAEDMEKAMLNSKLDAKGLVYRMMRSWMGDGLLLSKGPKWAKRRKLLTPSFHFSILDKFLDAFNEQAQYFAEKLSKLADGRYFDIAPLVTLCTLDIVCESIMGHKLEAQGGKSEEYVAAIHRFGILHLDRFRRPWLWSDFIYNLTEDGKESTRCVSILHDLTNKVIRERKLYPVDDGAVIDDNTQEVRKRRRLAFLDLLIEVQKRDATLTDEGIQEEVDTFMFGGHDTVATSIVYALHLIGRHPDVQMKIQKELDDVFDGKQGSSLTREDLGKMEYLGCVMKESQRLLTTVPVIGRSVEEEFRTCGVVVPAGASIVPYFFELHRDPKHFPNPDVFDPDRFLAANCEGRHNFAYLPFSAGHRNCIGQKFALMEQKVILATVLRKLHVRALQKTEDLRLSTELVLRPLDGVDVQLEKRHK